LARPPWERDIGFVFQNYALWPNKTIFDNVAYGLRLRKVSKSDIVRRVRDALEQVQLRNVEDRYPAEMSGGMQQRIAMARALVIDPPLLLLDEPMSNLDARLRVSLRQELRELQQRIGVTAIYVTHDQEEALELSDRIAVMNGGWWSSSRFPRTFMLVRRRVSSPNSSVMPISWRATLKALASVLPMVAGCPFIPAMSKARPHCSYGRSDFF
jgi:ABC-type Fe3+/spermidine/putrescine transport system ATPase subunit